MTHTRRVSHVGWAIGVLLAVASLVGCGKPPYPRGAVESLFEPAQRPVIATVHAGGRVLNTVMSLGVV